jgi:hypothetical protein
VFTAKATDESVAVEPLPGNGRADIRLVLVVGRQDLHVEPGAIELPDRLLRADHRALPGRVAVGP